MLFLRHPGDHLRELVIDVIAFLIYTPSAITSTYMLMLLCEAVSRSAIHRQSNVPSHIMAFSAVFGKIYVSLLVLEGAQKLFRFIKIKFLYSFFVKYGTV